MLIIHTPLLWRKLLSPGWDHPEQSSIGNRQEGRAKLPHRVWTCVLGRADATVWTGNSLWADRLLEICSIVIVYSIRLSEYAMDMMAVSFLSLHVGFPLGYPEIIAENFWVDLEGSYLPSTLSRKNICSTLRFSGKVHKIKPTTRDWYHRKQSRYTWYAC